MFEKIKEAIFGTNECQILGKTYPDGGVACIGDQCIQCNNGEWGPNKFEEEERQRNLEDY